MIIRFGFFYECIAEEIRVSGRIENTSLDLGREIRLWCPAEILRAICDVQRRGERRKKKKKRNDIRDVFASNPLGTGTVLSQDRTHIETLL